MNLSLSEEAVAFGEAARGALAAGPSALDGLGAWDLAPRSSPAEAEAAAALCRAAGWWAVTDPVAERLARIDGVDAVAVVAAPADEVGLRWATVDLDDPAAPLALTLPCWTLLGLLDRAMAEATAYVTQRHQFGQPLSSFQGVQFQLTDAEVERVGVEELAKYALWSGGLVDALALRVAAIEAAEVVFRVTHQVHGAIGFCDETLLSWLSRASQPLRRSPLTPSATRAALAARIAAGAPFTGLFG